jgi:uncharacterized protein DUF397
MPLPGAEETDQRTWRKASYCASTECIEVALYGTGAAVRDSKQPAVGHITYTSAQWSSLLYGIKSGQYDHLSR